jgi:hypothetical protein
MSVGDSTPPSSGQSHQAVGACPQQTLDLASQLLSSVAEMEQITQATAREAVSLAPKTLCTFSPSNTRL